MRLLKHKLRDHRCNILLHVWEQLKTEFESSIRDTFDGLKDQYLQLPDNGCWDEVGHEEVGIDDGYLALTVAEVMEEVFEHVLDNVASLIWDLLRRVSRNCKALLLLGESVSCQYIGKRVRGEFELHIGVIASPPPPELAISRGAVYAVLESWQQQESRSQEYYPQQPQQHYDSTMNGGRASSTPPPSPDPAARQRCHLAKVKVKAVDTT